MWCSGSRQAADTGWRSCAAPSRRGLRSATSTSYRRGDGMATSIRKGLAAAGCLLSVLAAAWPADAEVDFDQLRQAVRHGVRTEDRRLRIDVDSGAGGSKPRHAVKLRPMPVRQQHVGHPPGTPRLDHVESPTVAEVHQSPAVRPSHDVHVNGAGHLPDPVQNPLQCVRNHESLPRGTLPRARPFTG